MVNAAGDRPGGTRFRHANQFPSITNQFLDSARPNVAKLTDRPKIGDIDIQTEHMSLTGKAEILTPVMRLRRRKRAVKIFTGLLFLGLILLSATVLAVNDGRNYRRLVSWAGLDAYLARPIATQTQAQAPATARFRPAPRGVAVPERLTTRTIGDRAGFRAMPDLTAHERCLELTAEGAAAPSFQAAGGQWECLFSQDVGSIPEPSIVFIQVRGTSPTVFRTFRLKLSLLDPSQDSAAIRLALAAIEQFGLAFSPESSSYLAAKLTARQSFSSVLENYRITFEAERGDDRRFNLLITPRRLPQDCANVPSARRHAPMQSTIAPVSVGCLSLPATSGLRSGSVEPN